MGTMKKTMTEMIQEMSMITEDNIEIMIMTRGIVAMRMILAGFYFLHNLIPLNIKHKEETLQIDHILLL